MACQTMNRGKDTAPERALRSLADAKGDRVRSTRGSRTLLTSRFLRAGKAQCAVRLHDMGWQDAGRIAMRAPLPRSAKESRERFVLRRCWDAGAD
jgi:hypothetical protein